MPHPDLSFFTPKFRLFTIGFLFVAAFGIRAYHISEISLNFHVLRQHHSAIIVRGYYFESQDSIAAWRKEIARINQQDMAVLEPRIVEQLALEIQRNISSSPNLRRMKRNRR